MISVDLVTAVPALLSSLASLIWALRRSPTQ